MVEAPGGCLQQGTWLPIWGNGPRGNWWGGLGAEHLTLTWLKELGPGQTPRIASSSDTPVLKNSQSVPDLLFFPPYSFGASRVIRLLSICGIGFINTGQL